VLVMVTVMFSGIYPLCAGTFRTISSLAAATMAAPASSPRRKPGKLLPVAVIPRLGYAWLRCILFNGGIAAVSLHGIESRRL